MGAIIFGEENPVATESFQELSPREKETSEDVTVQLSKIPEIHEDGKLPEPELVEDPALKGTLKRLKTTVLDVVEKSKEQAIEEVTHSSHVIPKIKLGSVKPSKSVKSSSASKSQSVKDAAILDVLAKIKVQSLQNTNSSNYTSGVDPEDDDQAYASNYTMGVEPEDDDQDYSMPLIFNSSSLGGNDTLPDDTQRPIDLPREPVYMRHRFLNGPQSLKDKDIAAWDMSRDSKIADYADGQLLVAAVNGDGLYFSSDSGNSWDVYDVASYGVHNWLGVTINYEGEKLAVLVKGETPADTTLYRSSDFGVTWKLSKKAGPGNYGHIAGSFEGSKLYITDNGEIPAIKYTYDQCKSFGVTKNFPVPPGKWVALATDFFGENVYAASEQSSLGGMVYVSTDKAKSFSVIFSLGIKFWSAIYPQNWGSHVFFTAFDDTSIWFSKNAGDNVVIAGHAPYVNASLCVSFEQHGGGFVYAVKPVI
jgi:hypothetical protein